MIYLKNCTYIDYKTLLFNNTDILVESGIKGKIHFYKSKPQNINVSETIDCKGKIVTHAFANGHHHIYSALARGMGAPKKSPENFYEVLQYIWWTLDKCLDKDMIKASALATAIACAKNGVSFVVDHHASPNYIKNSLQIIADAFDEVGISHLLCYEITDRDGLNKTEEALSETDCYLGKNQGLVGLHASFTLSDNTLKKAVDIAAKHNSGIHIHVAEDEYDQYHCMSTYMQRVVERLNSFGVLDFEKSILGHCLHLDESERKRISESKAWIVQNMESNQNNRVGYFNSKGLGNRIILGTDGMHSDMLQSSRAVFLSGAGNEYVSPPDVYKRFRNVHKYIADNKFVADGDNNLVILDYDSPTELNAENFASHFVYGINSNHVDSLISNGNLVLKDKVVVNVDEVEILKFTRKEGAKLWKKMQK